MKIAMIAMCAGIFTSPAAYSESTDHVVDMRQVPFSPHHLRPLPVEKFQDLRGKSTREIVRIVGQPLFKRHYSHGLQYWGYGGTSRTYIVVIDNKFDFVGSRERSRGIAEGFNEVHP